MARPVLTWLVITAALAVVILVPILTIANCGGNEAKKLLEETSKSVSNMTSYHMTVSSFGDSQDLGKVQAEELAVDISGDNLRLTDTFFDQTGAPQVTQEIIKVGDQQYTKDTNSDAWSVDQATLSQQDISAYTNNISDFLIQSGSGKSVGEEDIEGVTTKHLLFTLTPAQVSNLAGGSNSQQSSSSSSTNFDYNQGGQVDIWIDPVTYYPARYEIVFKHIWVAQTSYADIQYVVTITQINQPIDITAPV
jgi:hypothetical protein